MKKAIIIISSAVLIVAMTAYLALTAFAATNVRENNWMSAVSSSARLTEINIPGTHDSATKYVSAGFISCTQSLSISQQFENGVRYIDTRFKKVENKFLAVHGIANCKVSGSAFAEDLTASHIIADCKAFLSSNPTETILFQLKEEESSAGVDFYTSFYNLYIKNSPESWFIENRIPTLGEVRGKIVLLRAVSLDTNRFNDSNSGIDFSRYPYIGDQTQYNYQRRDINKVNGTKYSSMYVQDSYKLEGAEKWECIKAFLDSDLKSNEFNICMTNCTRLSTPQLNAQDINKRIKNYGFQKGKCYGIIAMDFVTDEFCNLIVNTNNGVSISTEPPTSSAKPNGDTPGKTNPSGATETVSSGSVSTANVNTDLSTDVNSDGNAIDGTNSKAENTDISSADVQNTDAQKAEPQKKKNSKALIIIICAVAILIGAGVGAYFIIKKKQNGK